MSLLRLENEGAATDFSYIVGGHPRALPVGVLDLEPQELHVLVAQPLVWADRCGVDPEVTMEQLRPLHEAWVAHAGLPGPDQCQRLAYMMDRYLDQIDLDFTRAYPGVDPLELWRARRWRRLLVLLDGLPLGSAFSAATADDDEYVELLIANGVEPGSGPPPLRGWTSEVEFLARIADQMQLTRIAVVAANLGKGKTAPSFIATPRPVTAWDRAKIRKQRMNHDKIAKLFTPEGPPPTSLFDDDDDE